MVAVLPDDDNGLAEDDVLPDLVFPIVECEVFAYFRHGLAGRLVGGILVVQAAEQPVAGPRYLGRVEGQVLLFGHFDGNRLEILDERGAAEFAAAAPQAAQHFRFVAHPYLAHFNPGTEFLHKVLDQFPEVDPVFSGEIKNYFAAVEKPLHFDKVHRQLELFDKTGADLEGALLHFAEPVVLYGLVPGRPPDNGQRRRF
jgi:hypothetical protein